MTVTANSVLQCLQEVSELPPGGCGFRTIYEAGKGHKLEPSGNYFIDYASFPGGITEEIPRGLIDQLEDAGQIKRAFPDKPRINAWRLAR